MIFGLEALGRALITVALPARRGRRSVGPRGGVQGSRGSCGTSTLRSGSAAAAEDGSSRLSDARALARSDHVIEYAGRPLTDIKKSFRTAVGRAGLPAWLTPHVLKHSVISWLAEDGYTVDRISDMTDTDAVTVRRIYRKVNPEALEDMATSLAERLLVPNSATAGRTLENGG